MNDFNNMSATSLNISSSIVSVISTAASKLTASQKEHHLSLTFFLILFVVGLCILIVHLLLTANIHYIPESVAIVFLGALIGFILKMIGNWQQEEEFPPMVFFLVFLPPIIFESGYNLHKGNFFQNIGSILIFAVFGTIISAIVVGGGLYLCGIANLAYKLSIFESFGFGALISAVDPVATLAIFKAMDVDPILYMLVFGESILNDAVSIVLMTTIISLDRPELKNESPLKLLGKVIGGFLATFLASAAIGIVFALISALILKWIDLRRTPSLEVGMMLVFCYGPYCLAEAINMSGIMAILFAGVVMSHYTHINLSAVAQMTMQQIFRTLAFMAETIVFAYLGLAIFSFKHRFEPALIAWIMVLCLVGRACNIFPLSFLLNYFRDIKITKKNQVVMWFSGLRGAIAFALALHLEGVSKETQQVLVTATLIVVLCTISILGGFTMPFMKLITWVSDVFSSDCESDEDYQTTSTTTTMMKQRNRRSKKHLSKDGSTINGSTVSLLSKSRSNKRRRRQNSSSSTRAEVFISKTKEMGGTLQSEDNLSGYYDTEVEYFDLKKSENAVRKRRPENKAVISGDLSDDITPMGKVSPSLRGFMRLDAKYFFPFFTRCHTEKEVLEAHKIMNNITERWSKDVRTDKSEIDCGNSPSIPPSITSVLALNDNTKIEIEQADL